MRCMDRRDRRDRVRVLLPEVEQPLGASKAEELESVIEVRTTGSIMPPSDAIHGGALARRHTSPDQRRLPTELGVPTSPARPVVAVQPRRARVRDDEVRQVHGREWHAPPADALLGVRRRWSSTVGSVP